VLIRNEPAIRFNWGLSSPAPELPVNNFSARWSRWRRFAPGDYRFLLRADDGFRLYIDGRLVLDEWHPSNASRLHRVELDLQGTHRLAVEYYEETGVALAELTIEPVVEATAPPTATPQPTATPSPAPRQQAIQAAISHLVGLTGLPRSEIELLSQTAVDWPSSQLGCPREEVAGAQVITPGYRIILLARGQRYEYHTNRGSRVVLCPDEAGPTPAPTPTLAREIAPE
jgi:hypothetical protein